ncbi:hypothetical protein EI94DRAFT_1318721 [Lactarius quietus]|nr:hypothetical protein EI94DRAFT_1318721 [Lactarius quietus]
MKRYLSATRVLDKLIETFSLTPRAPSHTGHHPDFPGRVWGHSLGFLPMRSKKHGRHTKSGPSIVRAVAPRRTAKAKATKGENKSSKQEKLNGSGGSQRNQQSGRVRRCRLGRGAADSPICHAEHPRAYRTTTTVPARRSIPSKYYILNQG